MEDKVSLEKDSRRRLETKIQDLEQECQKWRQRCFHIEGEFAEYGGARSEGPKSDSSRIKRTWGALIAEVSVG